MGGTRLESSAGQGETGVPALGPDGLVAAIRARGLLPAGAPVVVLLSGGRDSTCLLDVAVRLAGAGAVAALHLDYRVRPESAEGARACARLCDRLAVPLTVERPERAPAGSGNFQAWARERRYAAGAALAETWGGPVAAGHTASDQAETVLYRLASSPGRRALEGMRSERALDGGGRLVRPLLGVTRAETTAYCRARGLAWQEDASNAGPRYARGRVRHGLLPVLEAIHPAAERNVARTAALLADEATALDEIVEAELGSDGTIGLGRLRALPLGLARLVVQRLADDAAGRRAPGAGRRTEEILALREPGALDLGHGVRACVRHGVLRMGRTPAPAHPREKRAHDGPATRAR